MSIEADIVERLRKHVNDRGGASIDNGAWQMMLDAAGEIEDLRLALGGCNTDWNKAIAERDAAARDMRERCASEAFFTLASVVISDTGGTELGDHVAAAIRALPDTPAILATELPSPGDGS
ncbi:hypothetical protein [Tardiphaga sp. 367_B4_N1_1]|uniref:hypothetical protein n=1 Tax=Tardiphaga sp. 367_B4_N1_1 TaxID=3240777 RepID=UPI003F2148AF